MTNNLKPKILFEDEKVMVIDKPVGLLVHKTKNSDLSQAETVVDWFLKTVPEAKGVGEQMADNEDEVYFDRSGLVHRLDRETSGVMILAKDNETYGFLKQQFKDRLVHKEYRAFVYGRIKDRWGTINRPIGRSSKDPRKRLVGKNLKGVVREAITDFEKIGIGEYEGETFSYLKLIPKTGRTHQLRVHLRALDRPIVGDKLYADYKMKDSNNLDLKRLALHAHVLELELPDLGQKRFVSPLPFEFELAAEKIA